MKPGVSTSTTSGSPNALQVRTKRAPFGAGVGVEHAAEVARLVGDHADRRARRGARSRRRCCAPSAARHSSRRPPSTMPRDRRRARRRPCARRPARPRPGRSRPGSARAPARRRAPRDAGGRWSSRSRTSSAASRRRSATKCATPLRSCTLRPPSSAALTSSPMTSRTTAGAGEEHARALGHHDEVGQRGRVGAAAGATRRRSPRSAGRGPTARRARGRCAP